MEPKTDIGQVASQVWDRVSEAAAEGADIVASGAVDLARGDAAYTSEREVARSRRAVQTATENVDTEQAEFEEALERFRGALAESGYEDLAEFDSRWAEAQAAVGNYMTARGDFRDAQDRLEAALDAPRNLDGRAEDMFRSQINLPEEAFQEAVADFRAHDRPDLADAMETARTELRAAAAAQRAADRAMTQYEAASQRLLEMNFTDGVALGFRRWQVEREHADVVDAIQDLVEAQAEYREDATQFATDQYNAAAEAFGAFANAANEALEAARSAEDAVNQPEAPEPPRLDLGGN